MEIKDEETVEQRTDKAYEAAKEQVLSGSKVEVIKAKEEVSMASETPPMNNTPMTVRPESRVSPTVNSVIGKNTSIYNQTQEQLENNIDQMRDNGIVELPKITNQPAQPLMEKSTSTAITRTRKPANTTSAKAVDAASIVEKMKEQISCIEYIAGIDVPEIATPNSKEARDILIKLQKDIEKCKTDAITSIQQLW